MAFRMARAAVSPPAGRLRSSSAARSWACCGPRRSAPAAGGDGAAGRRAARAAASTPSTGAGGPDGGSVGPGRRGAGGRAAGAGRRGRRAPAARRGRRRPRERRRRGAGRTLGGAGGAGGAGAGERSRGPSARRRAARGEAASGCRAGRRAGRVSPTSLRARRIGSRPVASSYVRERRLLGAAVVLRIGVPACRTRTIGPQLASCAPPVTLLHLVELGLRLLGELLGLVEEPHAATVARASASSARRASAWRVHVRPGVAAREPRLDRRAA